MSSGKSFHLSLYPDSFAQEQAMLLRNTHPDADDIVRVRQSTLIELNCEAKSLSLKSGKVNAQLNGPHLTNFKGLGMELEEVRPYQPGDDLYSIDWRVTARTGETHTKVFREERERPILMWVDYQQSMFFGTRNSFKSVLAAKTAALLAWSAVHHGDRVGGLIFNEQQHDEVRPLRGKKGALHFIHKLSEHSAWDDSQNNATDTQGSNATEGNTTQGNTTESNATEKNSTATLALQRLRRVTRPGSLIFLISDFYSFDESAQRNLAALTRHNDVVMLSISDPIEQQLPAAGFYRFSNGQSTLNINTYDRQTCQYFQQGYQQRQQQLKNLCMQLRMHHMNITTDGDLVSDLQNGLGLKR
jgi:uncharacterized protein (DUF58 family)